MHKSVYFWVETNLRRYYFTLLVKVVNDMFQCEVNVVDVWKIDGCLP